MGKKKARKFSMKCGARVPYKFKMPTKKKFCYRWAKKFVRKYIHECRKIHRGNKIATNLCLSRGQSLVNKWSKKCGRRIRYHPRMYKVHHADLRARKKKLDLASKIAAGLKSYKSRYGFGKKKRSLKKLSKKKKKQNKKLNKAIDGILKSHPGLLLKYKSKLPSILGIKRAGRFLKKNQEP